MIGTCIFLMCFMLTEFQSRTELYLVEFSPVSFFFMVETTLDALSCERTPYMIDVDDYNTELCTGLNSAWKLVQQNIENAQRHQKSNYDRHAKECPLMVGQRVMVCMPTEMQGKTWKFARPFHRPFRILTLTPTNAEVRIVDEPQSKSMFVSLNRFRTCYEELPDVLWKGLSPHKYTPTPQPVRLVKAGTNAGQGTKVGQGGAVPYTGSVTCPRSDKQ